MKSLLFLAIVVVYVVGVVKFWNGFHRTNFSSSKLVLSLLWPLFIFNASYRQNFRRALRG